MPRKIRPIRIEGQVAYVPLSQGYEAIIDVEDVPLVDGANWNALVVGRTVYAKRNTGPRSAQKTLLLHRVITAAEDGLEVDHRDGNGLNNRRRGEAGNLRLATHAQNQRNQLRPKNNTSGFKGVSLHKQTGKWQAYIMLNHKKRSLGLHVTREQARDAYARAVGDYHGEWGKTE